MRTQVAVKLDESEEYVAETVDKLNILFRNSDFKASYEVLKKASMTGVMATEYHLIVRKVGD